MRRERERSPRETFRYHERSTFRRSETSRNEPAEGVIQPRSSEHTEKDAILEVRSDLATQKVEEKKELVPVDNSLDLANEVLEAMNITEGNVGMEVDETAAPEGETEKATGGDEDLQDLTDEESQVKGAVN